MVTEDNIQAAIASSTVPEEQYVAILTLWRADLSDLAAELQVATDGRNPLGLQTAIDKMHQQIGALNATVSGINPPPPPPPPWPEEKAAAEKAHRPHVEPVADKPKTK